MYSFIDQYFNKISYFINNSIIFYYCFGCFLKIKFIINNYILLINFQFKVKAIESILNEIEEKLEAII
jgi:hypothetical protein